MRRITLTVALCAIALAGCGGGGGTHLYSVEKARTCLVGKHIPVRPAAADDFVASTATGGAFRATLPGNSVTVVMGQTIDDANNIDEAYRRFHAKNVGIDDVLRQDQNAVLLWHAHPTDEQALAIGSCLK